MFDNIIENLKRNNMNALAVETASDALEYIKNTIPSGSTVSNGGSVTLSEIGALDLMRNGNYNFLDRTADGLSRDDIEKSSSLISSLSSVNCLLLSSRIFLFSEISF